MTVEARKYPQPMCAVNPDECPAMHLNTGAPKRCLGQVEVVYDADESAEWREWVTEEVGRNCTDNLAIKAVLKAQEMGVEI